MKRSFPRVMMWVFGLVSMIGLASMLSLFQSSPGPLSDPHAAIIRSSFITSCKKCHTDDGLSAGCLACHTEIAEQLEQELGYHAYLNVNTSKGCGDCHPEHNGHDFSLITPIAWGKKARTNFNHAHVSFELNGAHDGLNCEACHAAKEQPAFALPEYPNHPRRESYLGLEQACNFCHKNVHDDERLDECSACHVQDSFKPAIHFDHDDYFKLEGPHAAADCKACHLPDEGQLKPDTNERLLSFSNVKGTTCKDCHTAPHRFEIIKGCKTCHLAQDESWRAGERGVSAQNHSEWGFDLKPPHHAVSCDQCHPPEIGYDQRHPDPALDGYMRNNHQCSGCHEGPHGEQFKPRYTECTDCHYGDRFVPVNIGIEQHSHVFPLTGAHRAVACIGCHLQDPETNVRMFSLTATACKDCHTYPHGEQFRKEVEQGDCTQCHEPSCQTFRISPFTHPSDPAFFNGVGHANAECNQCHRPNDEQVVIYRSTSKACAHCHQDVHRGQFAQTHQCRVCHASTADWKARGFSHQTHSIFQLEEAHKAVACTQCHPSVQQADGALVTQYKPISTRCEDCHGFENKQ